MLGSNTSIDHKSVTGLRSATNISQKGNTRPFIAVQAVEAQSGDACPKCTQLPWWSWGTPPCQTSAAHVAHKRRKMEGPPVFGGPR